VSDQPVVLAVATYPYKDGAEQDFHAVWGVKHEGELDHVAAAVLEKDADGKLKMDRHDSTAKHLAWGGALLGGALVVLAPPLGAAALVGTGAGAGGIVGHFWHNIPKDDLRRMGDLLEAGQAALVVVAVDHTGEDIGALLTNATSKIVLDTTRADFETAFSQAVEEAKEAEEAKTAS
jgi:uncharacterized membrane protein